MPRGWNQMPNGWWQRSLRGPRPPSESWPRVWESNGRNTSAVQKTPKVQGRVQCSEAAVAVLGPEDGVGRTMIEAALQRARDEKPADQSHQRTRWSPDVVQERARALQAMGDLQCPEADMLQETLKRARQSAQERPLANQISECTRFIERSTHRLAKIDAEREAEVAALEEARSRLVRLEAQSTMCPDVPMSTATKTGSDVIAELEELKAKLVSMERERDEALAAPACKRQAMSRTVMVREGTPPPIPDSRIPAELSSWMDDRHAELFAAITAGDQVRTQRLTSMMAECADRFNQLFEFQDNARIVSARYGQRGVRVGEASHPGPACNQF